MSFQGRNSPGDSGGRCLLCFCTQVAGGAVQAERQVVSRVCPGTGKRRVLEGRASGMCPCPPGLRRPEWLLVLLARSGSALDGPCRAVAADQGWVLAGMASAQASV